MGENLTFQVRTTMRENDDCQQENIFNLSDEQLALRQVEHVDIAVDQMPTGSGT